ncbi:hypothetical protein [Microbacterium sp. Mcb102]|uniref:hypothetical protein n=1 Tax=Microbacterium sp. Mcb102 TaxID=2926012 RepID=UPI0021C8A765|nr:hypothetical protein [Microbacterium sp. Mcb102]
MIDNISPLALLVALTMVVALWLYLGIRDRRRARRRDTAASVRLVRAQWEREHILGRCSAVWQDRDAWIVCTLRYEHTGPHLNHAHGCMADRGMVVRHDHYCRYPVRPCVCAVFVGTTHP